MGEPAELWEKRIKLLRPYQVNKGTHGDGETHRDFRALPALLPRP